MDVKSIHKTLVTGRFTLFVGVLVFLALRISVMPDWKNPDFWGATFVQISIALILLQINHIYTIIRSRTLLPTLFYLLFTGTNSSYFSEFTGSVTAFCIVLSLIFLFYSYQEPQSQINALNISLILTLGSLLWSPLLFFFPLFWYGFYQFRCLNVRMFFASLVGFFMIYLFIFAWGLYENNWDIFLSRLPHWKDLFVIQPLSLNLQEWVVVGFLLTLYGLAGFNLFMSGVAEKIRTSLFLSYLHGFSLVVFIFYLLQSGWKDEWGLIICIPASFVLAHFFTLSKKKISAYLLLFCLLFFLGMYIWQEFFPGMNIRL